jgi:hypothetical protein
MGRPVIVLSLAVLLSAPINSFAQTGSISGTVVDAVTLVPLGGTLDSPFRVYATLADGVVSYTGTTDALGHYSLGAVQPAPTLSR